jgi:hypothetical protein
LTIADRTSGEARPDALSKRFSPRCHATTRRWGPAGRLDLLAPGPALTCLLIRPHRALCASRNPCGPRALPTIFIALTTFRAPVLQLLGYLRELLFSFNLEIGREGSENPVLAPSGYASIPDTKNLAPERIVREVLVTATTRKGHPHSKAARQVPSVDTPRHLQS